MFRQSSVELLLARLLAQFLHVGPGGFRPGQHDFNVARQFGAGDRFHFGNSSLTIDLLFLQFVDRRVDLRRG